MICNAARLLLLALPLAAAAQPIAYPANGQSPTRQSKDEGECHQWAVKQSGVDPAALAATPVPQETGPAVGGGERAGGAARGALGGAAIGAIAGDAGTGAGVGAVVGTMAGGRRARQNQEARNQAAQQQQQAKMDSFNRAWSSCMSGRGYSIS
nr:glycine zipper domain-containing protein [Massilia horti]